jgi:superfamily II RNA helicase
MSGESGSDVWERTMLLINCPMIGLSATVNNGQNLTEWIGNIEKQRSILYKTSEPRQVQFISHHERLADLNKYLYSNGKLHPLHPVGLMSAKQLTSRGLPKDFLLSPCETLQLKDTMEKKSGMKSNQIQTVTEYFSPGWVVERSLCNTYSRLVCNQFNDLINNQQHSTIDAVAESLNPFNSSDICYPEPKPISSLIIDFLLMLKEKNLLPCIVFSDSRWLCEQMAKSVANYFKELEINLRKTKYKKDIEALEKRSRQNETHLRTAERQTKSSSRHRKSERRDHSADNLRMGEDDFKSHARLSGHEQKLLDGILDECNLSDQRGCDEKAVAKFFEQASWSNPELVEYMKRGIAYHHAGINNKGRVAVEALFRTRYIQIVFSTSTLGKYNKIRKILLN